MFRSAFSSLGLVAIGFVSTSYSEGERGDLESRENRIRLSIKTRLAGNSTWVLMPGPKAGVERDTDAMPAMEIQPLGWHETTSKLV